VVPGAPAGAPRPVGRLEPLGDALFQELLWVHRMIRRDLGTVRDLADDLLEHLEFEEVSVAETMRSMTAL
jgi:hypothetical protein